MPTFRPEFFLLDSRALHRQCSWAGAAIYILTHPTFIDFIHPTLYEPVRLIDREIACFFALASYRGGRFFSSEAKDS